jgi:urease accessory protein UreF
MLDPNVKTVEAGMELLGELHLFAERLGSPGELIGSSGTLLSLDFTVPRSVPALREFVAGHVSQILIPLELPAIYQAHSHASRQETRELIASDCLLHQEPKLRRWAAVSRCLGTAQLQKLLPLRDQRLVRRYWEAVESGRAHGWHTVVYGVILAIYSLPLRQGLLHYGDQVVRGFIESANGSLRSTPAQRRELHAELCSPLPKAIEGLLRRQAPAFAP